MQYIMARACISCKVYTIINPSDPINQYLIKLFEEKHSSHPIVSVSVYEIKDIYENVGNRLVGNMYQVI